MTEGFYYLHENGELIFKVGLPGTEKDLQDSDLVKQYWPIDDKNRATAWTVLVEGLAAGANKDTVMRLAKKWKCDDDDAKVFAERTGLTLSIDGNQKVAFENGFDNLQESMAGFGDTYLEAMADLCRQMKGGARA